MEATRQSMGLLDKIFPPRQEDAGLEEGTLPLDSIHEAFLKAASAVKSCAATLFHSDDEDEVESGCVDDPFPENGKFSFDILVSPSCKNMSDVVVLGGSLDPASDSDKGCVKEKGDGREVVEGKDTVVLGDNGVEAVDGKGCLDDKRKGLKIREKETKKNENQEEDGSGNEKPILVEGFE